MKLLLIEDDPMIGESMRTGLRQAGYTVDWVRDGQAAELALEATRYDLGILDLGLPRKDGMSVLKSLRQKNNNLPVIIVTARDAVADRIMGLNAGADDYLVKPFDLDELVARIRALSRRQAGRGESLLKIGALSLDPITKEVRLAAQAIHLSAREFSLLEALMQTPGAVLSRQELEERLYGWDEEVASNAIEVHLHNLRRKLGPQIIRNVRGVGYKIVMSDGLNP